MMDMAAKWVSSPRAKKTASVMLVFLLFFTGLLIISPMTEGTVTPGSPADLTVSGQLVHENSTAFPVWGFRATSNTGADTLDRVNVTLFNRGSFTLSDIKSISTTMSSSGVAIYRDDGSTDDALDSSDTGLSISSFFITGSTVVFNISSETIPSSTVGTHTWFIVIRTSTTIGSGDRFLVRLESNAIRFSDGTTMPSSRSDTQQIACRYITGSYTGTSSTVPIGEHGVDGDTIAIQGVSMFSGRADLEMLSSMTVELRSVSGFDPTVDLASIGTGSTSGIKLYLDDGASSADTFDETDDTRIVPSSISLTNVGGYWKVDVVLFTTGSNRVLLPASPTGNFDLFVVATTSSSISHGDTFHSTIPTLGLELLGSDGNSVNVFSITNRSRNIQADTRAPDLSTATLTIYSDSGHFYAEDTDLSGSDKVFYNSVTGEGLGQRITALFQGYTENFPDKLMGEPAFNNRPAGPLDDSDSTDQSVNYRIDATGYVTNPLTFTIRDKVGHETTWDVDYIKDNNPPVVSNVVIRDSSRYIYAVQPTRNIYFRPNMIFTDRFYLTGDALEPANESGLNKVNFTLEPSLASSPAEDTTPANWNGSYGVNSLSQNWNSPIYARIYDNVLNDWIIDFSYHRVTTLPIVEILAPTGNGVNVSGIYRVRARVDSDSPISKVEFGIDDDSEYEEMTYTGTNGNWRNYVYDWDTYDAGEGSHTIKVKATDVISGINYNTTWVNVNNYPLWGYFTTPTWNEALSGEVQLRVRVSDYCANAMFYVSNQLVGSWSGPPSGGMVYTNLNTALFSDGNYIVKVYLQGFGGRSKDISIPVIIDNTVPLITGISVVFPGVQEAAKVGDKIRLMATIADNTSGLFQTFAVANAIGGSMNQTLYDDGFHMDGSRDDTIFGSEQIDVDAPWGFHTIRFVVEDRAGNTIERKINMPVDPKPPLVEDAWVKYPADQGAAKTGDDIQVMARISDNTAPIYITLVLDNSGSMRGTKFDSLKKAAKVFINSTRDIDYVSIWRFYENGEDEHPGTHPGWPKRILNFTKMNTTGQAQARNLIDSMRAWAGTPIWDTIGNATKYTIQEAESTPVVVAFTDGSDNYDYELHNTFEEGSAHFAPWHDWDANRLVTSHWGKYEDIGYTIVNGSRVYNITRYYWVNSPINQFREGLLNSPIPIYTIGLGLEHYDPPNQPRRTTTPVNYEYDNVNAYWTGESGTTEYNLWRIATTSAGGSYYYAPSATQLETIYRNIARSIYSTDNPAKIVRAVANVPLDVTKQVLLFDDGLHNDGLADDGLYSSDNVNIPTLPTEGRVILIEVFDWADNIGLGECDLIIDNTLPRVETPVMVHYPAGRSSASDNEAFHMEIKAWDVGSDVFIVGADGTDLGFFPPITFNNTGLGNDINGSDMNYTSVDVFPNTGGAPSMYYFVEIIVTDLAGNSIKALAQVLVVNDKEAPVVEMIDPVINGALSGRDKISAIVTDDGVIRTVRYRILADIGDPPVEVRAGLMETENADIYEGSIDVSPLADGNYFLEVYANDTAGRIGSSGQFPIYLDNNAPSLRVTYPKNNDWVKGDVRILTNVTDRFVLDDEATYSIDNGASYPVTEWFNTQNYQSGPHQVEVRATDPAGQYDSVLLTLYFDNKVPDVTLISPTYGAMQEGVISIVADVEDGGGIELVEAMLYDWGDREVADPPTANETPFASVTLRGPEGQIVTRGQYQGIIDTKGVVDGEYLLVVLARDRSKDEFMALSYLPIDNNAPELKVLSPLDGGAITGNFTPEAEVFDPFLTKAYFTFNGQDHPLGTTLNLNGIPDGMYIMRFVAIDTSLRSTIVELDVFVDKTAPQVLLLSPADNSSHFGELHILASVRENSGIKYVFLQMDGYSVALGEPIGEGGLGGLYSFVLNLTSFNRSAHRIKVTAENMAGLVGSSVVRTVYNQFLDTDGDGVSDLYDDDPDDPRVHGDVDGDGFGSFYDDDDDGDGILDIYEPTGESFDPSGVSKGLTFKMDPTEWLDTDGDGIGDNSDPDKDGDGISNEIDAFPLDRSEWGDVDRDGIGDNLDPDIDGDGVINEKDDLKYDPLEWKDTDKDGVGNNKDEDDDGDGIPDDKDDYPLDKNKHYNWWPVIFIAFVALICAAILFSGMVFRENIQSGLSELMKGGGPKKENRQEEEPPKHSPKRPRPQHREEPAGKEPERPRARKFKENEKFEEEKEGFKVKWG